MQDHVLQLNQAIAAITMAPVLRSVKRGCCLLQRPWPSSAANYCAIRSWYPQQRLNSRLSWAQVYTNARFLLIYRSPAQNR